MVRKNGYIAATTIGILTVLSVSLIVQLQNKDQVKHIVLPPGRVPTYVFLTKAYEVFDIPRAGIIHIGAHHAEEMNIYKDKNIHDILWIEADPYAKKKLVEIVADDPGSKVAMFAATDSSDGTITLHRTSNDGVSSSILALKNHTLMSPNVKADGPVTVRQYRLDDYLKTKPEVAGIKYNVIVIDIQGAELIALKGAEQTLKSIDAIIAEVNYDELYANGVLINDLDKYLFSQGFIRVDSNSIKRGYGDALYVKKKYCTYS